MLKIQEYIEAMQFMGFKPIAKKHYSASISTELGVCRIVASYHRDNIRIITCGSKGSSIKTVDNVADAIKAIEHSYDKYMYSILENVAFTAISDRKAVMAAINTKNLAQNLVRCKSSNVWAYGMNIKDRKDKTGDLLMQFKDKNGGPGELYIYFDVPITVYRRMMSQPSVGHFFWTQIRNVYKYSHLTGNKRGILPNAINNW